MTRVIRWELGSCIVVDADQVANRIAILVPIKPADRHPARIEFLGVDSKSCVLDPVFQYPLFLAAGPRLAGWRHDATSDVLEHPRPELSITQPCRVGLHAVKSHPSFFHPIRVARAAVLFKDGLDLLHEWLRVQLGLHSSVRAGQRHAQR